MDHRLVVERQRLLGDGPRDRLQSCAASVGENVAALERARDDSSKRVAAEE